MVNSHCSIIARRLLEGVPVTESWLHSVRIRNHHKRLETIATKMFNNVDTNMLYWHHFKFGPIKNIGSKDGHPVKLKNGSITRCGIYVLPKKYHKFLKETIKRMNW